ncbi:hypothetical protein ABK040_006370 [Willaertia magna]
MSKISAEDFWKTSSTSYKNDDSDEEEYYRYSRYEEDEDEEDEYFVAVSKPVKSTNQANKQKEEQQKKEEEEAYLRKLNKKKKDSEKSSNVSASTTIEGVDDIYDYLYKHQQEQLQKKQKKANETQLKKKKASGGAANAPPKQRELSNIRTLEFNRGNVETSEEGKKKKKKQSSNSSTPTLSEGKSSSSSTSTPTSQQPTSLEEVAKSIKKEEIQKTIQSTQKNWPKDQEVLQIKDIIGMLEVKYAPFTWKNQDYNPDLPLNLLKQDVRQELTSWLEKVNPQALTEIVSFSILTLFTDEGSDIRPGKYNGLRTILQLALRVHPNALYESLPSIVNSKFTTLSGQNLKNYKWIVQQVLSSSPLATRFFVLRTALPYLVSKPNTKDNEIFDLLEKVLGEQQDKKKNKTDSSSGFKATEAPIPKNVLISMKQLYADESKFSSTERYERFRKIYERVIDESLTFDDKTCVSNFKDLISSLNKMKGEERNEQLRLLTVCIAKRPSICSNELKNAGKANSKQIEALFNYINESKVRLPSEAVENLRDLLNHLSDKGVNINASKLQEDLHRMESNVISEGTGMPIGGTIIFSLVFLILTVITVAFMLGFICIENPNNVLVGNQTLRQLCENVRPNVPQVVRELYKQIAKLLL